MFNTNTRKKPNIHEHAECTEQWESCFSLVWLHSSSRLLQPRPEETPSPSSTKLLVLCFDEIMSNGIFLLRWLQITIISVDCNILLSKISYLLMAFNHFPDVFWVFKHKTLQHRFNIDLSTNPNYNLSVCIWPGSLHFAFSSHSRNKIMLLLRLVWIFCEEINEVFNIFTESLVFLIFNLFLWMLANSLSSLILKNSWQLLNNGINGGGKKSKV